MTAEYRHIPVMPTQCREALALKPGEVYCDCTLGGAGHALIMAADINPSGLLIGIDQDNQALSAAAARISQAFPELSTKILKGNFADLDALLLEAAIPGIDGILFDLGVSSPQLDTPERGFSYAADAPLDFRMDPSTQTLTAAEIINTYNETDLAWIIRSFGEERWALRIARFIVKKREVAAIKTTTELVDIIRAAIPTKARLIGGHPAKRTFQAFRIYINKELEVLESGLESAIRWLNPGGRIAVISYHSLEDAIVKKLFAKMSQGCICEPEAPICTCGQQPIFCKTSKKPLVARSEELEANPRSKSAKLRWGIKK
ncbi:MAG: 16S rRNA (cytosine(1402)-N(4))-methyltransferase RsmH [Coriobacteriales bacterium]|nr:16S rRNA (cytosine(1402)-N(4))-methyltransferase RsmH [Coriobacteriales bacterium]